MAHTFNYARSLNYARLKLKTLAGSVSNGVTKPSIETNVNEVKFYYEEITEIFNQFKIDKQRQFGEISEETDEDQTVVELKLISDLEELTEIICIATGKAKSYINAFEAMNRDPNLSMTMNTSSAFGNGTKRRKIKIPEFDGCNPEKFLVFAAAFESMIHQDPDTPKVEKLLILKEHCKYNAHDLIAHMPLTETGYDNAWKQLNNHYRNMRTIIRAHFEALFSIKRIQNMSEIHQLYTDVMKALKGLEACNLQVNDWSEILSFLVSEKLDKQTYEDFERLHPSKTEFPLWKTLQTYLEERSSITKRKSDSKPEKTEKPEKSETRLLSNRTHKRYASLNAGSLPDSKSTGQPKCPICSQFHLIVNCELFKAKSPRERYESLKSKFVCRNCFKSNHPTNACSKPPNCKSCKLKHHTMLHFGEDESNPGTNTKAIEEKTVSSACVAQPMEPESSASSSLFATGSKPIVLLPTAVVKFKTGIRFGEMRVLLDSCSQVNIITESFVKRNKLPTFKNQFNRNVVGVNDIEQVCSQVASLTMESKTQPFKYDTSFVVTPHKLPYCIRDVPTTNLSTDLSSYKLADPAFYKSSITIPEIDALLGIQAYDYIVSGEVLKFGSMFLRNTKLGWTVTSTIYPKPSKRTNQDDTDSSLCCLSVNRIDQRLKLFWETEEAVSPKSVLSEAEMCNVHFEKTFQRNEEGKFFVRLPFKSDPSKITGNYDRVLAYQKRVEKRLTENVTKLYEEFMQEYIDLGHMTLIPNAEKSNRYFIPHHAVLKPSSTTTKLRVVFHASFEAHLKKSLNNVLMAGPVVQPELLDNLLRFHKYPFAVTCDVTKMYRCIWVHLNDRLFQSIIWKIFVRNRVAKIIPSYPADRWNHVASNQNPADIATRGISTENLINSTLWRNGPELLPTTKPDYKYDDQCSSYLSKPKVAVLLSTENKDSKLIYSCSSYTKLVRIFANAKALAHRKRSKLSDPLVIQTSDMLFAESYIIRIVQQCEFSDDHRRLINSRKLCKRSHLRSLTPYLDENGVIRSRSRLQNAGVPFDRKCPVILPAKGPFSTCLVRHVHERYFHANRSFLLTHLSTKFVFVGDVSRLIKDVVFKCVTCRRYFHQSKPQQLSDLPAVRVNPRPPFEVVGVDFTGAFNVKCNFHRVTKYAKAYVAIFVCKVTRAVHIEIVPSLTTEDFLNALKCFISRRGIPQSIFSDNGTNFRGTDRYLNLNLRDNTISKYAVENRINWRFNPPYTPHRGGIWEAAVKSAKRFIPIVTRDQTFSENELRVLMTQIECLLNSRPLSYQTTSEPGEEVLTPGHFLIGRNLTTLPEPAYHGTVKLSLQYRANRKRIHDFWKLWSTDYLNQLRCRTKWLDVQPNPAVGQIVLYKESSNPPSKWPLARIHRCLPDSNNVVRTVEIMIDGELKIVPTIHIVYCGALSPTRQQ